MVFLGGQFKSEMGGQFESATHGQFKSAQGGQFDRILHDGSVSTSNPAGSVLLGRALTSSAILTKQNF
jgi:hypothetical protein